MYPRVNIKLPKIEYNLRFLSEEMSKKNIGLMIVTKVVCADDEIIKIIARNEYVKHYADSRIENLISICHLEEEEKLQKKEKVLLRLPMKSDAVRTVKYADISLNSELDTIKALDIAAKAEGKKHKVVLMIDLGDLREGIYFTEEEKIFSTVDEILKLENIILEGIGANLTCYGAVIPHYDNLKVLSDYVEKIEDKFAIKLNIVSGGNSSSLHTMFIDELPDKINSLRIGEALYLANETAYSQKIEGMFDDCFELEAEIIECGKKPTLPVGDIGVDAFGKKPYYEDRGIIKRAIIAIGKQDIDLDCLQAIDDKISILGASSDHMIVDISQSDIDYKLGDTLSFKLNYGGLLKLFTSKYVSRKYFD